MTWLNVLIPFAVGIGKGFIKEYTAPPRAGGQQPTIVDSGRRGGLQWVAVRKGQARAFKAANPKAYHSDLLFNRMEQYQRSDPGCYNYLLPFAEQVLTATETYDGQCEVFVMTGG